MSDDLPSQLEGEPRPARFLREGDPGYEEKAQEYRNNLTASFDAGKIKIVNGYLIIEVGYHNCAGGTAESNYAHEEWCGWEPLQDLAEGAVFEVVDDRFTPG